MSSTATPSNQPTPEQKEATIQPEDPLQAERLLKRWLDLRSQARSYRRKADEAEKNAAELLASHPFLGNVSGVINKVGKRKVPPPSGAMEVDPVREGSNKKQKTAKKREAAVIGGQMTQKEINQEGGEVAPKTFFQPGRFDPGTDNLK